MALTAAEMVSGVNAAFADAATWQRAMLRLALVEKINEQRGVLAQGQLTIGKRNLAEATWVEAETVKLRALEAQLEGLAVRPVVPVEP